MAAHATANVQPALDLGGFERRIARLMPTLVLGMVAILGVAWWLAAQPPPGPGWGDPNGPQQQWPQGQNPQQNFQPPRPVPPQSSGCSMCAGDCLSGVDCADCANCIDCADCLSGLDCAGCTVAGGSSSTALMPAQPSPRRSCSTNPWKRLAGSSGLLFPLFVLIAWRRRLRR